MQKTVDWKKSISRIIVTVYDQSWWIGRRVLEWWIMGENSTLERVVCVYISLDRVVSFVRKRRSQKTKRARVGSKV